MNDVVSWTQQARRGSKEAFSNIVRCYEQNVRGYLSRYSQRSEVIDDLAQEVFIAAYKDLHRFDGKGPLGAWLLGIARHRALHYLRGESRRKKREGHSLDAALNDERIAHMETQTIDDTQDESAALSHCLDQLPSHSYDLIQAFYYNKSSAEQLAEGQGQKSSTIRMRLVRVRRRL
ncbi:MAG: sigma-70 family RNA polymerase sigma factor, partial [Planctomycetota bacterium]|nr:sigma-70 family RNA polymerase sigma factor [Planctomycetota bacterium]